MQKPFLASKLVRKFVDHSLRNFRAQIETFLQWRRPTNSSRFFYQNSVLLAKQTLPCLNTVKSHITGFMIFLLLLVDI